MASIVASSDSKYPGIASGASIIALDVASYSEGFSLDAVIDALNWTLNNAE